MNDELIINTAIIFVLKRCVLMCCQYIKYHICQLHTDYTSYQFSHLYLYRCVVVVELCRSFLIIQRQIFVNHCFLVVPIHNLHIILLCIVNRIVLLVVATSTTHTYIASRVVIHIYVVLLLHIYSHLLAVQFYNKKKNKDQPNPIYMHTNVSFS